MINENCAIFLALQKSVQRLAERGRRSRGVDIDCLVKPKTSPGSINTMLIVVGYYLIYKKFLFSACFVIMMMEPVNFFWGNHVLDASERHSLWKIYSTGTWRNGKAENQIKVLLNSNLVATGVTVESQIDTWLGLSVTPSISCKIYTAWGYFPV